MHDVFFPAGSLAVVVGVGGSIGRMIARQMLESGLDVVGVDLADGALARARWLRADATEPGPELQQVLGGASIVVLALSQQVLLKALPKMLPHLASSCLLVETLSIKTPFAQWLQTQTLQQPVLGINPMFSGDLDPTGRPVAVVSYGSSAASLAFTAMLQRWQLDTVHLQAAQHDEAMATLQAVGHASVLAFGQTLARSAQGLGAVLKLAPPPFRVMLALLARMTQNHPDVYWEIQSDNPYAAAARHNLIEAMHAIDAGIGAHEHAGFRAALAQLKQTLVEPNSAYVETSRQIFEFINQPAQPQAPSTLPQYRLAIDRIDDQLIDLLGERLKLIGEVAHHKKSSNTPVMQPGRVMEVVQRCKERGRRWHIRGELVEQLYQLIIEEACHIEYDHVGGPRENLVESSASAFGAGAKPQ